MNTAPAHLIDLPSIRAYLDEMLGIVRPDDPAQFCVEADAPPVEE